MPPTVCSHNVVDGGILIVHCVHLAPCLAEIHGVVRALAQPPQGLGSRPPQPPQALEVIRGDPPSAKLHHRTPDAAALTRKAHPHQQALPGAVQTLWHRYHLLTFQTTC